MGFFSFLFGKQEVKSEDIVDNEKLKAMSKEERREYLTELSRKNYEADGLVYIPTEDKREPNCPNCSHSLDKIPERKKECPHCGKQIYTYAKEVSPGKWERHLTGEEEGVSHYKAIEEENARFLVKVQSGEYKKEAIDNIVQNGFKNEIHLSGGGCEMCIGFDKIMSPEAAYNHPPVCPNCGYGYTVTGRIIGI